MSTDTARRGHGSAGRVPRWVTPLLLGLLCLLVYNANLRTIGSGDTLPARYLPFILWHDGTLELDGNARLVAHGHRLADTVSPAGAPYFEPFAYWMIPVRHDHLASLYPVVAPLLVAPLYLPAMAILHRNGWRQPGLDRIAELMEKVSASFLAACASVVMFLILRRERIRWALPLALAFAFGTNTWMISSQALWQHGSGELLIALALLLALGRKTPLPTAALGLVCVLIAANRPVDTLVAGAFLLHAVWGQKRDAKWLVVGASLPLAGLLAYNLLFIGNLFGGYGEKGSGGFLQYDPLGIPGLLISPARGLFVFTPFLLFVALGIRERLRSPDSRRLTAVLGIAIVAELVVYSIGDWRAGVSWGPRWLTDILPILVWMLAPAPAMLRPRLRGVFVVTVVAAVGVQTIGAFWYTGTSDERFAGAPSQWKRAVWDPRNTPFVVELRHKHASRDLLCDGKGAIDRIGETVLPSSAGTPEIAPGAVLQGWARTCNHAPTQVLLLIDGALVGATSAFVDRPDVDRALGGTSPSGWEVTADTRNVSPGPHILQLAVQNGPRSDPRIVREERVTMVGRPGLPELAARAAERLRGDQNPAGYWLTSYTSDTSYESPAPEMNTFLTAMLVDLLTPIGQQPGLDATLARARRHLAAQIESNGLVRYHGLPDGPTIGTLGCAITPDSDDTALVWRVTATGAGDPRMRRMLRILDRYRDARGLYRTWLSKQSAFQCINPGHDPDPADLTIQMHVYLMLRELDPPAARSLCAAMRRAAGDDSVWVYYARTPLLAYLRAAQLRGLGCSIPIPPERLGHVAPGQEVWVNVVRRLVASLGSPPDGRDRRAISALLARLGANDFALLRSTPPLLYHNDLTASVSRYYWSTDAGYALWLRLYAALGAS